MMSWNGTIFCRGSGSLSLRRWFIVFLLGFWFSHCLAIPEIQKDLDWNVKTNRVSADIRAGELTQTLEQIAAYTGWSVFVEPDTKLTVSARFKDLVPGEALRLLYQEQGL
jgi:hypothetical protein